MTSPHLAAASAAWTRIETAFAVIRAAFDDDFTTMLAAPGGPSADDVATLARLADELEAFLARFTGKEARP